MLISYPNYAAFELLDLTITKIETTSTFAGKLGRKVSETLFVKASNGQTFSITLSAYHTRFGSPTKTFKVGDQITASARSWQDRALVGIR